MVLLQRIGAIFFFFLPGLEVKISWHVGEIWDMLQKVAKRHLASKELYGRKSDTCVDFEDGICSESSPIAVFNCFYRCTVHSDM
jgi:hypothetical protein